MLTFSVVIPTYRRRGKLQRCLAAVLTQSLDAAEYEVLVCDDAGEPDLADAVRAVGERFGRFDLRYLPPGERRGPAAARNRGWRAARGRIVAFTDDDCVPSMDWLEEGLRAMDGLDAAQGRILVPLRDHPTDYELNASHLEEAACATANFFCRREALEETGGFDERFRKAWREDSDLHFSLLERGRRVGRARRAVVVHPVAQARWGFGLEQQANSYYDALLYKKHPKLYLQVIGGPPWQYYVAAGCLLMGVGGWLSGLELWRAALAVWAAWTVLFCAKRLARTSKSPRHVIEMAVTSALIPLIAVFWRLRGAVAFRVPFF